MKVGKINGCVVIDMTKSI
ncbi:Protein of unknown function [Bacillus mycoides]|nr:Protein of unknown function [Bacillus mycoides]